MSSERRYRGRTPGEAMRKARAELGENARLVGAQRITPPGVAPLYEVRVTPGVVARREEDDAIGQLRREVEALRASLGAMQTVRAAGVTAAPHPVHLPVAAAPWSTDVVDAPLDPPDALAALLRRRGVGDALARSIAERARGGGEPDAIAGLTRALAEALATPGIPEDLGRRSTIVLGPAGGGKTTTLAKIAADVVARGGAPVLVCVDGESLAGEDALSAIAAALGLPFETAFLDGQLEAVVERRGRKIQYLVDTPGRTPDEPGAMESLAALVHSVPDPDVLLVAPAATESEELRRLVAGFASLGVERLVLTKLDELAQPGRLVELARTLPRPIGWVTFGRSARGAGSTPDDPRVIARLLGTNLTVERSA